MNFKALSVILTLSTITAGCVLVVNPDEEDGSWQSDWESDGTAEQRAYAPQSAMPGLAELVARSYGRDDLLRDADIRVTARGEVVSLHGRVPTKAHFDRAVELGLATEGVGKLESRLTVEVSNP